MNEKLKEIALWLIAAFGLGVLMTLAVDAFFHDLDREAAIGECMYEHTACEYIRCESVVDDVPMTEEDLRVCP
jgi:hypothetical protein